MSCSQGVANCKHRDAAPVLFGRAASAADQVRRLASLNAKLGGRGQSLSRLGAARAPKTFTTRSVRGQRPASLMRLEMSGHRRSRKACVARAAGATCGPGGDPRRTGVADALASGFAASHEQLTTREVAPTINFVVPSPPNYAVELRAAFQARSGAQRHAGCRNSRTIEICSRRDAAPVLFGRAASAADAVRRLVSLNAKLRSRARYGRSWEQRARPKRTERGRVLGRKAGFKDASRVTCARPTENMQQARCMVRRAGRAAGPRRKM